MVNHAWEPTDDLLYYIIRFFSNNSVVCNDVSRWGHLCTRPSERGLEVIHGYVHPACLVSSTPPSLQLIVIHSHLSIRTASFIPQNNWHFRKWSVCKSRSFWPKRNVLLMWPERTKGFAVRTTTAVKAALWQEQIWAALHCRLRWGSTSARHEFWSSRLAFLYRRVRVETDYFTSPSSTIINMVGSG